MCPDTIRLSASCGGRGGDDDVDGVDDGDHDDAHDGEDVVGRVLAVVHTRIV